MSLLGWTGVGLASAFAIERYRFAQLKKQHRQNIRYVRIVPHQSNQVDAERIQRLMDLLAGFKRTESERLKKGREWFRFMIHKDLNGGISFFVGFPEDRTSGIKKSFRSIYPDSEIHDVRHEDIPLPKKEKVYGGKFVFREKGPRAGLPLRSFDSKHDNLPDVLLAMDAGEKLSSVWLDVVFSPSSQKHLKKLVLRAENAIRPNSNQHRDQRNNLNNVTEQISGFGREVLHELGGRNSQKNPRKNDKPKPASTSTLDMDEQARLKALRRRFTGHEPVFFVSVSLAATGKNIGGNAQTAATTVSSMMSYYNGLQFLKDSRIGTLREIAPMPASYSTMIWTGAELASLLHLPDGEHRINEFVYSLQRGERSLKAGELSDGIVIGYSTHPLQKGREVRISHEQFTKHYTLTGATGTGKSSTEVQMCQSQIDEWVENPNAPGFSFFDPARETVAILLNRLLKKELDGKKVDWSRVHYIRVGPSDFSIGLNLLIDGEGSGETDSVVGDVLALLKYAYGGSTPQMDRILRNALATLVEDSELHTVLGIVPLLQDEKFRARILPRIKDPIVMQFWKNEFPSLESKMDQAISPILNRLSPFITNKTMRRMFGQKQWGVPLRKWMDEGHIVLWDMFGLKDEQIKLAGGHLMNQYHYTAIQRPPGSKPHVTKVDEAHMFQVPIMNTILAFDRKFGLCLGLITQFVAQFEDWLIDSVRENVGTILSCAQGPESAAAVSTMTAGHFDKKYLQTMPERVVAVYTKIKGEDGRSRIATTTAESDPPVMYLPNGNIANYKDVNELEVARQWALAKGQELLKRDGKHVDDVDLEIHNYLNPQTPIQITSPTSSKNQTTPTGGGLYDSIGLPWAYGDDELDD